METHGAGSGPPGNPDLGLESTASLVQRMQAGEEGARDALLARYLARLRSWAHGRLPKSARDLLDTDDVVQDTFLRTLSRMERFVPEGNGTFLAYLRETLLNRIRDLIRRAGRRPGKETLEDIYPDRTPSPVENVIGKETLARYDQAMTTLPGQDQEVLMLRIEMGFSNEEIARHLGCPSSNAARMMVARALLRLAKAMGIPDGKP